ncbi:4-deoxy-L-threo-5-hexosulose-uronate ketol-isomerase [Acholeplasma oculi]|uniref:4-deoxy-L-threo-5-hexosulose-uronate ketol-isomerase n=1 Tax=Acholeplasma oculi TaxID=35623 RepID=A0A061AJS3_9MOLU|nr:5-dehydro-4-deoxy-D-glucuronate isomerase [Acholeplasma oculi]CDR31222.1 4-deoxy-L-threo-5-hexosulose-uronate ketol-isomerase [Acholeplasma oculi]SKC38105.1 4-deoxy-L-threo-5-hexosulose-uronate ketol-isomerase [Acholeplasma oculi]SUT91242.1 4-deoxy-L-threo-5-hexosulose-uronate ketol-isomerase [Acholeplasma oculi]
MKLDIRYNNHPEDSKKYDTKTLRERYLIEEVFTKDTLNFTYSHHDRIIAGGIMPVEKTVALGSTKELGTEYFLERREMGIINVGGEGLIIIDGVSYSMVHKDGIYIPKGTKEVLFKSVDANNPAKFYMNSSPAHKVLPIVHIPFSKANPRKIGDPKNLNKRTIYQYLNPAVLETCALQMGLTELEEGNAWNTMPAHTHDRRMEVYFYFNLSKDDVVFHLMGEPTETRHIILKNEQAVISPSWSIHAGFATSAYTFIWGMTGENQTYDDMDFVKSTDLK